MNATTGVILALGVGAGMLLIGNMADAQRGDAELKKKLNLLPGTPLFLGSYVEGQRVPKPGVYLNRQAAKVFATTPDGDELVYSSKATALYRALVGE